jgi:cell division protein FtsI/penicillin-binding protein 2
MHRQKKAVRFYHWLNREQKILWFFGIFFLIVVIRLFWLQIVNWSYYQELLAGQHLTSTRLEARRWQIFVTDKWWTNIQMTENVELFWLFVDPKYVVTEAQKQQAIAILTPITYDHFCVDHGLDSPTKLECIQHLQQFLWEELLPQEDRYYVFTGDTLLFINEEEYQQSVQSILDEMDTERIKQRIATRYDQLIQGGLRTRNYLVEITDDELKAILRQEPYSTYTDLISNQFLYTLPLTISNPDARASELWRLLRSYNMDIDNARIRWAMRPQEIRYIKLLDWLNAKLTKRILDAKFATNSERYWSDRIPLMHGFWLEKTEKRYYPHWFFMSHILGYMDVNNEAFFWVEQYFDKELSGEDWAIIWLATPWIWQIWANNFDIREPKDWVNIYLTIDPVIQKELESMIAYHNWSLWSDSVAVTVLDPQTWKVKAMANFPNFNPNDYQDSFKIRPILHAERWVISNYSYVDIPLFGLSWSTLVSLPMTERESTPWPKYIYDSIQWPQVFVNRNISFPYEPWSIVKTLTLAIWVDSDSINMYDYYDDPLWSVQIWPFTIANIDQKCLWTNTFTHALWFSCNVWMVRIAQQMTKYVFYNYMEKLWFWQDTTIELANAQPWTLPSFNNVSVARFFNNTFWQWFLATPLHMAVAYWALVNWWEYIQPTLVEKIFDPNTNQYLPLPKKERRQVFKPETSELIIESLRWTFEHWHLQRFQKDQVRLWWKTWTSEIAYRWQYQSWAWWTIWSIVWIVSWDNPRYVVSIQVSRPRWSPRWADTAWRIFSQLADFLISYDSIDR